MDLIKKLTGKNPSEYETVAKQMIDNSDVELFKKLVKQDDFLFDFIKDNVSKRIQNACNKENYKNLLKFLNYYSPSYDTMIARVLYSFSGDELLDEMKEIYHNGNDSQKAYAVKYFSFVSKYLINDMIPLLRKSARSEYEPLSMNSIEVLSMLNDEEFKSQILAQLDSEDEFEQYEAVKFLVNFGAKDSLDKIIEIMKKSGMSENIASEIPYLIPLNELMEKDFDSGVLVLCYIINEIPEIIPPASVCDYGIYEVLNNLPLNSSTAVLLSLAKEKFEELVSNDEYLFDSDKNTKDEVKEINSMLKKYDINKLKSLLYDELYDESDFVFFAVDFVDEVEELETLLDSKNQALVVKVLTILKEKGYLNQKHKDIALENIFSDDVKQFVVVL